MYFAGLSSYTVSWFYKFSTNSAFSSAVEQQLYIMEKSKITSAGMRQMGWWGFQGGAASLLCTITRSTCVVCFHLKSQVSLGEYELAQECRA